MGGIRARAAAGNSEFTLSSRDFISTRPFTFWATSIMAVESASATIATLRTKLRARMNDLRAATNADTVTMFCYDRDSDRFLLPLSLGLFDTASFEKDMPRTDRLAGKIVKESCRVVVEEVETHPDVNGPFSHRERIKSSAGVPIAINGETVGVVFISYRRHHLFREAELQAIGGFAREAAELIVASQAMVELCKSSGLAESEEQQVLQGIVEVISSAMNLPVAIWLRDRKPQSFSVHAATGVIAEYEENAVAFLTDDSVVSRVICSGESLSILDLQHDPRFKYPALALKAGWESLLVIPLKIKGHIIGAIEIFSFDAREFSRAELEKITIMTGRIGLAIENYRRIQELKVFNQVVQTLGAILDPERALQEIVDGARTVTQADTGAIFFFSRTYRQEVFRLACHSPRLAEPISHKPRPIGGLSRHIIDTGQSIIIGETTEDMRVHQEVATAGTRALIGVPVQVGSERSGVLYVTSSQHYAFGDYDVELLRNLASHAAAALQRVQLLDALNQIEHATSKIYDLENVTQNLLRATRELGFDFGAVQLIDRATDTIETIQGIGMAQAWTGIAKHRLNMEARDIQADIALTLNVEIISGWDPRFDQWIFKQFNHQRLVRIFVPIFLVRDHDGNLHPPKLDLYEWNRPQEIQTRDGCVVRFRPGEEVIARKPYQIEVIGTIEAGYFLEHRHWISNEEAQRFYLLVCDWARTIWETQLANVLETIVKNAMHLISADSASIRLLYNEEDDRYGFLACAGKIGPEFLELIKPKKGGLGEQAIREREPKTLDHDLEIHYPEHYYLTELKQLYPERYRADEGVRAIACFPLLVSESQHGLLFLHFWREHHFSSEELEWGKLFADQAVAALKNTLVFQEKRQATKALDSLHSLGQVLVSKPQVRVRELLQRVAQSAINLLNADVIIVYLYDQQSDSFPLLPPLVEGRLLQEPPMMGRIEYNDTPSCIIREIRQNIYAPDAPNHPIICDRTRVRPRGKEQPYVDRERIKSAAGILFQVGSEIVGIMFVNYRTRHEFTYEERRLIETFASAAAIGIYNARLFSTTDKKLRQRLEQLTTHVNELRHLQEVSTAITYSSTDLRDVLKQITKGARSVLNADVALIFPYEAATKTFNMKAAEYDGLPEGLEVSDLPRPTGVTAAVMESSEQYLVVDDVENPPPPVALRIGEGFLGRIKVRSFLGVLLRVATEGTAENHTEKETVGVLYIDFLSPHTFKKEEIQLAQMFGDYAATAIAAARLREHRLAMEKLAAINAFGARFAHRVGNLLGTVPVNFEAIERLLRRVELPDLRDHLELLRDDVQKVQRILEAGRHLRRFGSGHQENFDLTALLRELTAAQILPANIQLSLELEEKVPALSLNRAVLVDIFSDMIENALYAMAETGGTLTISARHLSQLRMVEVCVRDTGCGIAPHVLERLGEPFFTTKEANLGLGVWLCRQAVEDMGGKLLFTSEVNVGTAFTIQLPLPA